MIRKRGVELKKTGRSTGSRVRVHAGKQTMWPSGVVSKRSLPKLPSGARAQCVVIPVATVGTSLSLNGDNISTNWSSFNFRPGPMTERPSPGDATTR